MGALDTSPSKKVSISFENSSGITMAA
jgi:hypothetical protein